jgi:hypothetical protein
MSGAHGPGVVSERRRHPPPVDTLYAVMTWIGLLAALITFLLGLAATSLGAVTISGPIMPAI